MHVRRSARAIRPTLGLQPDMGVSNSAIARRRSHRGIVTKRPADADLPQKPPAAVVLAPADSAKDPRTLSLYGLPTEPMADVLARGSLKASVQAALTIEAYAIGALPGPLSLDTLASELTKFCKETHDGDLSRSESSLTTQAQTLNAIFNSLARMATYHIANNFPSADALLRLALKAQNQSRMTIETLNLMKNPPSAMFVKQANVANGPQQVNNGSRVGKIENQPNELLALEERDGARVDFGAATTPSGAHSNVASLGAVKRTANDGGKDSCEP